MLKDFSKLHLMAAHERISQFVHRTPVFSNPQLNEQLGCEVYIKAENLQQIGAFKARGAMNAALLLSTEERARGLTTHSSGNHAQAIALAAKRLGTRAYIVMPRTAPQVKINGVKALGGEIIFCEPTLAAREETVEKVIAETGATFIHPFDNEHVIEGQATAAMELFQETPPLDALLVPVGGGGLWSGTCVAARHFSPKTQVWAAEPEGAADAIRSFASGQVEKAPYIDTIADGLLTTLSDQTLQLARAYAAGVLPCTDAEIVQAMRLYFEQFKLVVEPSGAVSLAALQRHAGQFTGKRIGLIISGGNVDLEKYRELMG